MDTNNIVSTEPLDLASGRHFNDSAIRVYALGCSVAIKGGRFTRVGEDFMDEVKADAEALIRGIRLEFPIQMHEPVATNLTFTTGALVDRLQEVLNGAIARLI